jgi:hypothetical protein
MDKNQREVRWNRHVHSGRHGQKPRILEVCHDLGPRVWRDRIRFYFDYSIGNNLSVKVMRMARGGRKFGSLGERY